MQSGRTMARRTRALFISVSLTAAWAVSREICHPSKEAGFQSPD